MNTTAQLRNAAWDAEQAGDFATAHELYCQAIENYPRSNAASELEKRDIAGLTTRVKACKSRARSTS